MKRIKLDAYFANNLGDDLMVDILLKRYPQYRFWVDSASPALNKFLNYPNFESRSTICQKYGRLNHILNILTFYRKEDFLLHRLFKRQTKKCCCAVYIGGSLFMQGQGETGVGRVEAEEKRLENGPLFIIGANFGPYHTQDFRQAFSEFFRKCGGVTFRDRASCSLFESLPNVAYAPDVVLNLPVPQEDDRDNTVIISVIDMAGRKNLAEYAHAYESFIGAFCQLCVERGKTPVLMSFCEAEGDCRAMKRIWDALEPEVREQTRIYEYKENIQEALAAIAGAEFVLATRFHAMILALRMGKPFYCISYNDKIKWVLDDLQCDAYCQLQEVGSLGMEAFFSKFTQAVDADAYMQTAVHQFDQFDRYMKNESK